MVICGGDFKTDLVPYSSEIPLLILSIFVLRGSGRLMAMKYEWLIGIYIII
jgi:hypothetical protein